MGGGPARRLVIRGRGLARGRVDGEPERVAYRAWRCVIRVVSEGRFLRSEVVRRRRVDGIHELDHRAPDRGPRDGPGRRLGRRGGIERRRSHDHVHVAACRAQIGARGRRAHGRVDPDPVDVRETSDGRVPRLLHVEAEEALVVVRVRIDALAEVATADDVGRVAGMDGQRSDSPLTGHVAIDGKVDGDHEGVVGKSGWPGHGGDPVSVLRRPVGPVRHGHGRRGVDRRRTAAIRAAGREDLERRRDGVLAEIDRGTAQADRREDTHAEAGGRARRHEPVARVLGTDDALRDGEGLGVRAGEVVGVARVGRGGRGRAGVGVVRVGDGGTAGDGAGTRDQGGARRQAEACVRRAGRAGQRGGGRGLVDREGLGVRAGGVIGVARVGRGRGRAAGVAVVRVADGQALVEATGARDRRGARREGRAGVGHAGRAGHRRGGRGLVDGEGLGGGARVVGRRRRTWRRQRGAREC